MAWWRDRIATSTELRLGLRMARTDGGFTLLELLIVMAVLGILAGIVVFSLQGVGSSATVAACQSDFATTTDAVTAYQAQMGGYPGGSGSATATDSDLGTAPGFTPGAAPSGVNAARPGGELLVSGATSPNLGGTSNEGPWLKESPESPGSYTIWVANDGSGIVQVLDAAGQVPAGATHTAKDCSVCFGWGRGHDYDDHGPDDNDNDNDDDDHSTDHDDDYHSTNYDDHPRADNNHHRATDDDHNHGASQPAASHHQRGLDDVSPRRLRLFHSDRVRLASALAEGIGVSALGSQLRSDDRCAQRYSEEVGLLPADVHREQWHSAECDAIVHADRRMTEMVTRVLIACFSRMRWTL